ncbi:MAG: hypothetical protein ACWGSD_14470, partial [Thermodesulfobacteriota bacterium]
MKLPTFTPPSAETRCAGLAGSSRALFLSRLPGKTLVISGKEEESRQLYADAVFFSRLLRTDEPVYLPPRYPADMGPRLSALETILTGRA